ncbi:MAG: hypothetical protein OD918_00050 [Gammaproteobacteria bacterium]
MTENAVTPIAFFLQQCQKRRMQIAKQTRLMKHFHFGLTDAITGKHRKYPVSFVVPIKK